MTLSSWGGAERDADRGRDVDEGRVGLPRPRLVRVRLGEARGRRSPRRHRGGHRRRRPSADPAPGGAAGRPADRSRRASGRPSRTVRRLPVAAAIRASLCMIHDRAVPPSLSMLTVGRVARRDGDAHRRRPPVAHDQRGEQGDAGQLRVGVPGEAGAGEHQLEVTGAGEQGVPAGDAVLVDDPVVTAVEAPDEADRAVAALRPLAEHGVLDRLTVVDRRGGPGDRHRRRSRRWPTGRS